MAISDKLHQVGAPEQQDSENDSVIEDCGDIGRSWLYNFLEMDGGMGGGVQLSRFIFAFFCSLLVNTAHGNVSCAS
jgi:hypothetical protein